MRLYYSAGLIEERRSTEPAWPLRRGRFLSRRTARVHLASPRVTHHTSMAQIAHQDVEFSGRRKKDPWDGSGRLYSVMLESRILKAELMKSQSVAMGERRQQ